MTGSHCVIFWWHSIASVLPKFELPNLGHLWGFVPYLWCNV